MYNNYAMEDKIFYMYKISSLLSISKIVTIHYQKLLKDYVSFREKHNFWEINYSDKNEFYCNCEGKRVLIKKGQIFFIRPEAEHGIEGNGTDDSNLFIISFDCKSKTMNYFKDKLFTVPEDLRFLLSEIMTEAKGTFKIPEFNPHLSKLELVAKPNIGGAQLIKNNLEELLIRLIRIETAKPTSNEVFISKIDNSTRTEDEVIKILENNIYNKIKLDYVCSKLHYSKTSLCQIFKKYTKTSIINFYLKLKIDESKKLIRENKSFTEIASLLYFDSLPHFTKTFKKFNNMTPREYKNSIL